jgi:hypothetical protein
MKKIIVLLATCFMSPLMARIGCMDNSWHLTQKYDNKEMHFVDCACDCNDTLGTCALCGHIHNAQPWTIIEQKNNHPSHNSKKQIKLATPLTVKQALAKMIEIHQEMNKISE